MNLLSKFISKIFQPTQTKHGNNIIVNVDDEHKINLSIDMNNFSSEAAEQFGMMLFLLNEGYYMQTLMDLVIDLSKSNNEHAVFAQKILSSWSNKITLNNHASQNDEEPIVKPSFFNVK